MSDDVRTIVLELPSDAAMPAVVRGALRGLIEACKDVRLDMREIDEVALVVQEACTNAIRHAHCNDASVKFRVEIGRLDHGLEIIVHDHGAPFSMPDAPPEPEVLSEGGYGVHIMRSWMDEVSVTRRADGNSVRLVRHYRTPAMREEGSLALRS